MSDWTSGPVPTEARVISNLRQSNEKLREALDEALRESRSRKFTAFWRGSIFGALLATGAFIASAAMGQTIEIGGIGYMGNKITPGSTVTINPSDKPGEWAIVVFENRLVNDGQDTGEYALTFQDVVLPVLFTWEQNPLLGSDGVKIIPPVGMECIPADCSMVVMEGSTGQVIILDYMGY